MKKFITAIILLALSGAVAGAEPFDITIAGDVPPEAAKVLEQRFSQMMEGVEAQPGDTLVVSAALVERMETPGSMSQSVVVLNVKAAARGQEVIFIVRGVGKDESDAWLRAVKQILPRSRAAQEFVEKIR